MSRAIIQLEKWKQKVPPEVEFSDVRMVAEAYFNPEDLRSGPPGSHMLIIGGPIMAEAVRFRDRGLSSLAWLSGNTLTISVVKGRRVKRVYVEQLVKLIEFKQQMTTHPRDRNP